MEEGISEYAVMSPLGNVEKWESVLAFSYGGIIAWWVGLETLGITLLWYEKVPCHLEKEHGKRP